MSFKHFKQAIAQRFAEMAKQGLYRVAVTPDELRDQYLNAYGPNQPIWRVRTEHDCSACKSFVRKLGGVVTINDDNTIGTIWDVVVADERYQVAANEMRALVLSRQIENVFLTTERTAGVDVNRMEKDGKVEEYDHFFVNIPVHQYVVDGECIGKDLSDARATHDVFLRGLLTITPDAVETVLELIGQNSIYRGQEHKANLVKFRELLAEFLPINNVTRMEHALRFTPGGAVDLGGDFLIPIQADHYVWRMMPKPGGNRVGDRTTVSGVVSHLRNTSIGTLLVDLSEGVDVEEAVKKFERMVAPENYKRPTALVTPKMVEAAKAKVEELGLTSALGRRYATLDDVPVDNLLFVDRSAPVALVEEKDVFAQVADQAGGRRFDAKVEEVPVARFLAEVLPSAKKLEVYVEGDHTGNFVNLTTGVDATAGRMFKWDNAFGWAYRGGLALLA